MKFSKHSLILWGMILVFVLALGLISVLRHYHFQTQAWDMGIFVQTFWNTSHGRIMQNSIEEVRNHLGVHMSPFLFLLVPGFILAPSPYYLLIVQTLVIALGAWPLYLLALRILKNKNLALLIAGGYLLYPPLHAVTLYDFHPIAFLPPLLAAAFYFIEIEKWKWAALFLALAAATQEDAVLVVLFVGIYLLVRKSGNWLSREKKIGLAVALLSLLWFFISIKIIMPALDGGLLRLDRYTNLGGTPLEILMNIIRHPGILYETIFTSPKMSYLFWLFLPAAFLPFLSWRALILLIPGLLQNLLTSYEPQFSSRYQYDASLVAGIFVGSIYGLQALQRINRLRWERSLKWGLAGLIAIAFLIRSPLGPRHFPIFLFRENQQGETFQALVKIVPPRASVSANTNLVPHLAKREHIYMLGAEPYPVEVVLIDGADLFGFSDTAALQTYLDQYLHMGFYEVRVLEKRYFILVHKKLHLFGF